MSLDSWIFAGVMISGPFSFICGFWIGLRGQDIRWIKAIDRVREYAYTHWSNDAPLADCTLRRVLEIMEKP